MPIYEYSCAKCGKIIEKIQKFSDPPLVKHEACGGSLSKLISQSSFHLKGSGWYVTDYASKGSKTEDKKDGDSASAKSDSNKTDTTKAGTDGKTTTADSTSKKPTKAGTDS